VRSGARNRELWNLIVVGLLMSAGFASVYIARQEQVSSTSLTAAGFFFALYLVLRHFSRHPPGGSLSWLGFVPNIAHHASSHWSGFLLLAIYAASQVASTYFMSATMPQSQRVMMMILPLVFIFFLLNFPIGLVLYWVTTNLWTVGQGRVTRRLVAKTPAPPKRSSRTPPRAEEPGGDGANSEPEAPKQPAASAPKQPPRRVKRKKRARR